MITIPINKIIKFSSVDGPGNRMAIFLQGCNYDCGYCHNPETIKMCSSCKTCMGHCPVGALVKPDNKIVWNEKKCINCDKCIKVCPKNASPMVKSYSLEEILEEVKKAALFIKGVTISGGESTLYYKELTELFKMIKKETSLDCFIDTNGSLPLKEERYKEFVEVTDKFMLDVKSWDKKKHKKLTGKGNKNVLENLKFLMDKGKLFEVRTVVVPGELDNKETIDEVSRVIGGKNIRYKIIKYRNIGVRKDRLVGVESPDNEMMEELKKISLKNDVEDIVIV